MTKPKSTHWPPVLQAAVAIAAITAAVVLILAGHEVWIFALLALAFLVVL